MEGCVEMSVIVLVSRATVNHNVPNAFFLDTDIVMQPLLLDKYDAGGVWVECREHISNTDTELL